MKTSCWILKSDWTWVLIFFFCLQHQLYIYVLFCFLFCLFFFRGAFAFGNICNFWKFLDIYRLSIKIKGWGNKQEVVTVKINYFVCPQLFTGWDIGTFHLDIYEVPSPLKVSSAFLTDALISYWIHTTIVKDVFASCSIKISTQWN